MLLQLECWSQWNWLTEIILLENVSDASLSLVSVCVFEVCCLFNIGNEK